MPVPPGFRQVFPTAIPTRARHPRRVSPTKLMWRTTCTGQRTERRSRRHPGVRCAVASRARRLRFEERRRTSIPSSATSGHPLSSVRAPKGEEPRFRRSDRSRPAFRRRPAKDTAIRQTRMPSTVDDDESSPTQMTLRRLPRVGPSLTPPTRSSHRWAEVLVTGLASATVRSPAIRGLRESCAFVARWTVRAWD